MSFVSNNRRGDAGVTSIEVALTFGLFIMLVLSVIDLEPLLLFATGAHDLGQSHGPSDLCLQQPAQSDPDTTGAGRGLRAIARSRPAAAANLDP